MFDIDWNMVTDLRRIALGHTPTDANGTRQQNGIGQSGKHRIPCCSNLRGRTGDNSVARIKFSTWLSSDCNILPLGNV